MVSTLSPFAEIMPRLYELKDAVPDPTHPDAYFQNFEKNLARSSHVQDQYKKLERTLGVLDAEAWRDLKERASQYLMVRDHGGRGWQALFDTLNEAKGYTYLRRCGYTSIAFIKRANKKTPDLRAVYDGTTVFCEVKTINVSQDEAARRAQIAQGAVMASEVPNHVTPGMLHKVRATLEDSIEQLDTQDPQRAARRIVFTVLTFDDWVGDYQTEYIAQVDGHLLANPVAGAELVFCPASNLFERRFTMRSATIVEI